VRLVGRMDVNDAPPQHEWRAVPRAQEGTRFTAPVSTAEVVVEELTDEDRMATTWTNLTFEQVRDAVSEELRELESTAARGTTSMAAAATRSASQWETFYGAVCEECLLWADCWFDWQSATPAHSSRIAITCSEITLSSLRICLREPECWNAGVARATPYGPC
jgi:hypothetical protein